MSVTRYKLLALQLEVQVCLPCSQGPGYVGPSVRSLSVLVLHYNIPSNQPRQTLWKSTFISPKHCAGTHNTRNKYRRSAQLSLSLPISSVVITWSYSNSLENRKKVICPDCTTTHNATKYWGWFPFFVIMDCTMADHLMQWFSTP